MDFAVSSENYPCLSLWPLFVGSPCCTRLLKKEKHSSALQALDTRATNQERESSIHAGWVRMKRTAAQVLDTHRQASYTDRKSTLSPSEPGGE